MTQSTKKNKRRKKMEICDVCHNFWINKNLDPLITSKWNQSFVKDQHTVGEKMARSGRKTVIYEGHSFRISLYLFSINAANQNTV